MNSQQFDALTRAAGTVSRRTVLRWIGAGVAGTLFGGLRGWSAAAATLANALNRSAGRTNGPADGSVDGPLPPVYPWSPENPPDLDDIIDDYLDCISKGHSPEECDRGFPGFDWCQIVWEVLTEAIPTLSGFASTFTPFSRNCGARDCFQCCYVPAKGCHSSFIGFPVINCTPNIYGAGTKPVGLTLILDPNVEPTDSCLFIPQVCTHIGLCVSPQPASGARRSAARRSAPQASADDHMADPGAGEQRAGADDYLADPHAIEQRARYFAQQVQTELRAYLDTYATNASDARPLQSLVEALTNRGRAGWRRDLTDHPIDITHSAVRVNDAAGNLNESASWANAAQLLALARVLSGAPNLAARLAFVESRTWTEADRAGYLAQVGDPYQALLGSLDAHWIAILQRIGMLQDYSLLAVPLAGEAGATGQHGGQLLGRAPVLRLHALTNGDEIALSIRIDDPEDAAAGLARPVAVDWGDGHATHHSLPAGQSTLDVAHVYDSAGRYAIYAVAASNSGLRGHAAIIADAVAGAVADAVATRTRALLAALPAVLPASLPAITRIHLPAMSMAYLGFLQRFSLDARLVDETGASFRAGRGLQVSGPTDIRTVIDLGDLYAHNPARFNTSVLRLEPRIEMAAPASASFVAYLTLATITLGVFSTSTQQLVEQPVTLTPEMLKLYVAGTDTPLPSDTVTVDADGTLHVPLFRRESSSAPWEKIVRVDIELTTAMFDGFSLNNSTLTAPPGTQRAWVETRPSELAAVSSQVFMPLMLH